MMCLHNGPELEWCISPFQHCDGHDAQKVIGMCEPANKAVMVKQQISVRLLGAAEKTVGVLVVGGFTDIEPH